MTETITRSPKADARPSIFRAAIDRMERHQVVISDEFQRSGYASVRRDLNVHAGDAVQVDDRDGK